MALGPRLDLRQTQALVMTPQLQQAIKLLQMSNLEVASFVEQQIEQNPLLEREDTDGADPIQGAGDTDGAGPAENHSSAEAFGADDGGAPDMDYENLWDAGSPYDGRAESEGWTAAWDGAGGRNGANGADGIGLEHVVAREVTLREHLLEQIHVDLAGPVDRMIALQLVEMLDESGYLTGDMAALAASLGCSPERVEKVIDAVQRFEPAGIFARSLSECLALQLRDRNRLDPAMEALLENLDLLARRDFSTLRRLCAVSDEDFVDMVNEIKALNPKPASVFDHVVAQPVTPDVFVRAAPGGGWTVELNTDTLPRVLVNSRYYARVRARATSKADKQYLIDCYQSASWLVKSLQQRAQTILKVAAELVDQQSAFFAKGVSHLKPLTLRDIAEAVGVHESTVSRVTNNKYIGTARGIFEMKYLFTSAVGQGVNGDIHAAEAIRFRIRKMIDKERPDGVLSDDQIVKILRGEGVEIARRTVAKYRESMRIPSSVQRRREKSLI